MHKVLSRTVLAIAAAGTMALSACTAPMFGIVNNGPVANLSGSDYAKSGNMKRIHAKVSTTYVFGFPVDAKEVAFSTTNKMLATKCQGGSLENIVTDESMTNFFVGYVIHFREEATCIMPKGR